MFDALVTDITAIQVAALAAVGTAIGLGLAVWALGFGIRKIKGGLNKGS